MKKNKKIVGETQSQVAIKVANRIEVYSKPLTLQEKQSCIKQIY